MYIKGLARVVDTIDISSIHKQHHRRSGINNDAGDMVKKSIEVEADFSTVHKQWTKASVGGKDVAHRVPQIIRILDVVSQPVDIDKEAVQVKLNFEAFLGCLRYFSSCLR